MAHGPNGPPPCSLPCGADRTVLEQGARARRQDGVELVSAEPACMARGVETFPRSSTVVFCRGFRVAILGSAIMGRRSAIVLAAGQGTRMKSQRAKVLFDVCGVPIVHHVVRATLEAGIDDVIVVVGFDGDAVTRSLATDVFGEPRAHRCRSRSSAERAMPSGAPCLLYRYRCRRRARPLRRYPVSRAG